MAAPEHRRRLAQPFLTTKGTGGGLGLGTFPARLFAERLNGSLAFESEVGVGTKAILEFPRIDHDGIGDQSVRGQKEILTRRQNQWLRMTPACSGTSARPGKPPGFRRIGIARVRHQKFSKIILLARMIPVAVPVETACATVRIADRVSPQA